MTTRKNITLDDEVEDLLDTHNPENLSETIRELLRAHFTIDTPDADAAAIEARRRELQRQRAELEDELATIDEELERLAELDAERETEGGLKAAIDELEVADPELVDRENPAVQRLAREYDVDVDSVAEAVRERATTTHLTNLSSVESD